MDISQPTAKARLSVLEASWQVMLLQPWHSKLTKRLIKTPKLYMLDTGLAAWLTRWSSAETLSAAAMARPMLETWVVAEVLETDGALSAKDRAAARAHPDLIRGLLIATISTTTAYCWHGHRGGPYGSW